jgi:hypothetical protein
MVGARSYDVGATLPCSADGAIGAGNGSDHRPSIARGRERRGFTLAAMAKAWSTTVARTAARAILIDDLD